MTKKRS